MAERTDGATSEPTAWTDADSLSRAGLLEWAARYAESVDLDVEADRIEWELSERAKRRAGACLYDPADGTVTIRLTWAAYRAYDPETFAGVVRHELVHAWEFQRFGESDHGQRFRRRASAVDAPLSCPTFATPRLRLVCPDCEWVLDRHRASGTVTHPERRRCGACGASYHVRHVETGETWRTHAGYLDARDRIGDGW